jgi:O-antigen ligase
MNIVDGGVLAFSAYLLIRNADPQGGFLAAKYALLGVGLFYLSAMLVRRFSLTRLMMWLFLSLALITSLYVIVEYVLKENIIYQPYITDTVREPVNGLHRVGSTLAHPVPFGAFLIQVLPFCLLAWFLAKSRSQRVLSLAVTGMAVMALFLSFSKGSWIIAVITAGIIVTHEAWKRSWKGVYLIVIFVAVLGLVVGVFWEQVITEMGSRSEISVRGRMISWEAALEGIAEKPLFGVGLKQGDSVVYNHYDSESRAWVDKEGVSTPVDNYYLNIFLEEGLIGIMLWLLTLCLIIYEGIRYIGRNTSERRWALAALAGIVGLSLNAMTFDIMLIWSNFVIFWVTAGLLHGLALRKPVEIAPSLPE